MILSLEKLLTLALFGYRIDSNAAEYCQYWWVPERARLFPLTMGVFLLLLQLFEKAILLASLNVCVLTGFVNVAVELCCHLITYLNGTLKCKVVPFPAALSTTSVPPASRARSRIPSRP
jgi:hypothetical protein